MRTLLVLSLLARGWSFPTKAATPSYSTPEFSVDGRLTSEPITDHTTNLQVTLAARGNHWLDANPSYDVGGGCCFEQVHDEHPALERCGFDAKKICKAVFDVPYRLSGAGQAVGSVSFSVCDSGGCAVRKVAVSVPYQTRY